MYFPCRSYQLVSKLYIQVGNSAIAASQVRQIKLFFVIKATVTTVATAVASTVLTPSSVSEMIKSKINY